MNHHKRNVDNQMEILPVWNNIRWYSRLSRVASWMEQVFAGGTCCTQRGFRGCAQSSSGFVAVRGPAGL